jgi:hypothetical protein
MFETTNQINTSTSLYIDLFQTHPHEPNEPLIYMIIDVRTCFLDLSSMIPMNLLPYPSDFSDVLIPICWSSGIAVRKG